MGIKILKILIIFFIIFFNTLQKSRSSNDFFSVIISNYQKDCKYCFNKEPNNKFSFGQCPISFKSETRFNFINTSSKYIYIIESMTEKLNLNVNEEFYVFPVFSDNRMIISSTLTRKCLTNLLYYPDYDDTPKKENFDFFFNDCDYTGLTESQLFIFEDKDSFQFSKYKIVLYYVSNPYFPNSNTIIPIPDVDYLRSTGLFFYLSYNGIANKSLKFDLISNEFTIYLPSPTPNNQNYYVYSESPSNVNLGDYCKYDFAFREIPYKTIPYYGGFRCFESMRILLNLNKVNTVTFKIKDMTNNKAETTDRIQNGSTINFNLISHVSTNSPYTLINTSGLSSFTKTLEFGQYSLLLNLSDTIKWRYDIITFEINSCSYVEIEIPIYINEYDVTFKFKNDSTGVYIDCSVLSDLSNIDYNNDSGGLNYFYQINHFTIIPSFTLKMRYGIYYVSLILNNPALHNYITQVVNVKSTHTFDIKIYEKETEVTVVFMNNTKSETVTTGFLADNSDLTIGTKIKNVKATNDSSLLFNLPVGNHTISLTTKFPLVIQFIGPLNIIISNENPITITLNFTTILFDFYPNGIAYMTLPVGNTSMVKRISWENIGTDVITTWNKVQVLPYSLDDIWFRVSDYTYTSSTGQIINSNHFGTITQFRFASALGCESPNSIDATAYVNFAGTPFRFRVDAESKIIPTGYMPNGDVVIQPDRKSAIIRGGGYCGGNSPTIRSGTGDIFDGIVEYVPP